MRVVLDTNVVLAAIFTRGVCEAVLDACLESHTIVLSEHILAEFARHAGGKFGAPAPDVRAAVEYLRRQAEIVEPAPVPPESCSDSDDRPVLGTAIAGNAEALVTGVRELRSLRHAGRAPILSPREFLDRVR